MWSEIGVDGSRYRSRLTAGLFFYSIDLIYLVFELLSVFTTSKFSDPSAFYFHDAIPKGLAAKGRVREDLLLLSLTAVETSANTFWIVDRQEIKV